MFDPLDLFLSADFLKGLVLYRNSPPIFLALLLLVLVAQHDVTMSRDVVVSGEITDRVTACCY